MGAGDEYDRDVGPPNATIADDVNVPPGARNVNDTAGFRRYCTNTSEPWPCILRYASFLNCCSALLLVLVKCAVVRICSAQRLTMDLV